MHPQDESIPTLAPDVLQAIYDRLEAQERRLQAQDRELDELRANASLGDPHISQKARSTTLTPYPELITHYPAAGEEQFFEAALPNPVPHYKDPEQLFIPLVRNLRNLQHAVTVDRTSNHLKHYLEMIPRPPGAPRLKARAIGATRALMKGVFVEDVMIQENWSSPAIVDSFYRLSRQTANNFTTAVFP